MEASPNGESISASEVNKEKLASSMIHGLNFQHRQHAESKFKPYSVSHLKLTLLVDISQPQILEHVDRKSIFHALKDERARAHTMLSQFMEFHLFLNPTSI